MTSPAVYDLLIVGGGINGAGIAADAAGRGLKVALCEMHDLGSATSSASTKLIHGGLRYLEQYEFRLVREALSEREVLLLIARGHSNREAGAHLGISQRTIEVHRARVMEKFGARNAADLMRIVLGG